ncbi:hypothetical protein VTH8203_01523 [Vibrio thalassae]|uniref:Uncharacterized protein n=1 Tax=Vibrio thalassae TaxID=1243014 RepID=A0A240EGU3_9VIBR|nr:hypothetical protein [Vibrio thalassae]SNX47908.1 hypothetical protein VTH8203_01523 [Vibrio thalassae]
MYVKTCMACQKVFNTECDGEEEPIGLCEKCVGWQSRHSQDINNHREKMVKAFSPAVTAEFNKMSPNEQAFVVFRSMDLHAKASSLAR